MSTISSATGRPARPQRRHSGVEAFVEGAAVGDAGQGIGQDQRAQGVALALDGELGPHPRPHHGGIHRLADEVGGAGAQRAGLVLGRLEGGDEDDRDVARLGRREQFLAHGVTVHAGHDGVEQDQVGPLGAGDVERARTVHREQYLVLILQGACRIWMFSIASSTTRMRPLTAMSVKPMHPPCIQ
jgi:hypothetical protein